MLLNKEMAYRMMLEQDLDALVLAYTENVMYFSDFLRVRSNRIKSRLSYVTFFRDEALAPAFLVPHQDYLDSSAHTWIEDVRRNWPFLRDRRIDAYSSITARFLEKEGS